MTLGFSPGPALCFFRVYPLPGLTLCLCSALGLVKGNPLKSPALDVSSTYHSAVTCLKLELFIIPSLTKPAPPLSLITLFLNGNFMLPVFQPLLKNNNNKKKSFKDTALKETPIRMEELANQHRNQPEK